MLIFNLSYPQSSLFIIKLADSIKIIAAVLPAFVPLGSPAAHNDSLLGVTSANY